MGADNQAEKVLAQMRNRELILQRLTMLYDPDVADQWMDAPHPRLDGLSPWEAIRADRIREVEAILDQLESGAFA